MIKLDEASDALRAEIDRVNVEMGQDVKATVDAMDKDGDGQIDLAEYLAGGGTEEEFKALDADGTGHIDVEFLHKSEHEESILHKARVFFVIFKSANLSLLMAALKISVGLLWSHALQDITTSFIGKDTYENNTIETADGDYVAVELLLGFIAYVVVWGGTWLTLNVRVVGPDGVPADQKSSLSWRCFMRCSLSHFLGFRLLKLVQSFFWWNKIWREYSHTAGSMCGLSSNMHGEEFYGFNEHAISTSFTQKEFSETEEAEVDSICAFPKMEMEEEMFRRFDPQRWGEVVGHYILGLLILVATSLLVMAVMHWLVERFRTRATNQEEEEALDKKREAERAVAADVMGLTLGYFFGRFAFFFVFGFCFLVRKQLVTSACEVTPDVLAVLALSLVFLSLLTTTGKLNGHKNFLSHDLLPQELLQQTLSFTYGYFLVWLIQYTADQIVSSFLGITHYGQETLQFKELEYESFDEVLKYHTGGGAKDPRAGPFWLIWITYFLGILVIVQVQYALLWAAKQSEQVADLINKLYSMDHVDKTTKATARHQTARVTKEVNNKNMMRLVKISGQGVAVGVLFERWVTGLIDASDYPHRAVVLSTTSVCVTTFAYLALYLARCGVSVAHEPEESAQNADACETQPGIAMMNLPPAVDRVDETQEIEPQATDEQM